jgi:hypothetical protein
MDNNMSQLENIAGAFNNRARGKVVDFADAAPELKSEMEKAMEPIDRNPDSLPAVIAYGMAEIEDIQKIMDRINDIFATTPPTTAGILPLMKEAEKLGISRVEATRALAVPLGAAKEVLRRYNEEYIPEAKKQFEESQDAENGLYLADVMKRKEDFIDRITLLESTRAASVIAAQGLRNKMEEWESWRRSGTLPTAIPILKPLRLRVKTDSPCAV